MNSVERKIARRRGELINRMVRASIGVACDYDTGEVIEPETLLQRARWLNGIVVPEAQKRIVEVWEHRSVQRIVEPKLPSHAWVAMEKVYGKPAWPPAGLHASDRVRRIAEELAGRTLRSAARRLGILDALIPQWMPDDEYAKLDKAQRKEHAERVWEAMPDGTTQVELTHARRQLRKFYRANERAPVDAYEVSKCPEIKRLTAPLDAADDQGVRMHQREDGAWLLSVNMPLKANPGQQDWSWVVIQISLPAWARVRYSEDWWACRPTLQFTDKGAIKLLVPMERPTPAKNALRRPIAGAYMQVRCFPFDWGIRTMATGAVIEPGLTPEHYVFASGRPYQLDTTQAQTNLYRTREHAEHLAAKVEHYDELLRNQSDPAERAELERLRDQKLAEKTRQWHHVSELSEQIACTVALWICTQAIAEDCNLVGCEDLSEMEARELGRTLNGRCSLQVRGELVKRVKALCEVFGLGFVSCEPRGTSSQCPRCAGRARHWHAPDNPKLTKPRKRRKTDAPDAKLPKRKAHENWLCCRHCGHSADRDHAAAERIGARCLELYRLILADEQADRDAGRARTRKRAEKRERELRAGQKHTSRVRTRHSHRSRIHNLPPHRSSKSRRLHEAAQPQHTEAVVRSPRSVSRGVAVSASQAAAVITPTGDRAAPISQYSLPGPTRRLDGMLQANQGHIRFTRVRARPPGHGPRLGLMKTDEIS